jgi:hypothetical protein
MHTIEVRQLVAKLPAHLKLQLRRCSKQMQQLVDSGGLQLRLSQQRLATNAAALQLCRQQLASLDITGLFLRSSDAGTQGEQPMQASVIKAAAAGLPCLRQLACDAAQVQLLMEVAVYSPRLAHLKLYSKAALTAADKACWETLHQRLPGALHAQGNCAV